MRNRKSVDWILGKSCSNLKIQERTIRALTAGEASEIREARLLVGDSSHGNTLEAQPGRQRGNYSRDLLTAFNSQSDIPISTPLSSWQSFLTKLEGGVLSSVLISTARCCGEHPSLQRSPGCSCSWGCHPGGVTLGVTVTPWGSQGTVLLHAGLERVPRKHLCTSWNRVSPCSGCADPASSLHPVPKGRGTGTSTLRPHY